MPMKPSWPRSIKGKAIALESQDPLEKEKAFYLRAFMSRFHIPLLPPWPYRLNKQDQFYFQYCNCETKPQIVWEGIPWPWNIFCRAMWLLDIHGQYHHNLELKFSYHNHQSPNAYMCLFHWKGFQTFPNSYTNRISEHFHLCALYGNWGCFSIVAEHSAPVSLLQATSKKVKVIS